MKLLLYLYHAVDDWSNNMKKAASDRILEIGTELISKAGYNSVGLNEILEKASIPKGSFYYYFKNKEDFGLQMLDFYTSKNSEFINSFLSNTEVDPKQRIFDLFRAVQGTYKEQGYIEGCLLGNSSLELAGQKKAFAQKIADSFNQWQTLFTETIREGQEKGSIRKDFTAEEYATFLLNSWEGALVRTKSTKNDEPMNIFIRFMEKLF